MSKAEDKELSITEILNIIQTELKAPKGQENKFGNYKYRSCEDILNALKPFLLKYKCVIILRDEIVNIGDRFYVRAKVTLAKACGEGVSTDAYAREELTKKGMDASQITGATSSYARKYALNALFAIDDTKDADATNKHNDDEVDELVEQIKAASDKGDWAALSVMSRQEIWAEAWGKLDSHKKGKINTLCKKCDEYRDGLNLLAEKDDQGGALELWDEMDKPQKNAVWDTLSENTQDYIKSIKTGAAA